MLWIIILQFRHLQDLQINKKNYFEEGAFNGASSFFVWFLNKKMNNE